MAGFALGTVQLGLPYGAANLTGMPTEEQAVAIVGHAIKHGVTSFDTADAYQISQERLGVALKAAPPTPAGGDGLTVVTKINGQIHESCSSAEEVRAQVNASVQKSVAQLGMAQLDACLLHQWARHGPSLHGNAAYTELKRLKADGVIKKVGTSTYDPEEVIEALADPETGHVQVPFNVLDWRWREAGIAEVCAKRPDVTVHARSCFLQGILCCTSEDRWPARFGRDLAKEYVAKLGMLAKKLGRKNQADLCLAYSRAQPWITEVLVGAETLEQLQELIELCKTPPLTADQVEEVDATLPKAPPDLLNPGKWLENPTYAGSFGTGFLGPEIETPPE